MNKSIQLYITLVLLLLIPVSGLAQKAEIKINSDKLIQGEFINLKVHNVKEENLNIVFNGKKSPFYTKKPGQHNTYIPISYWLSPGKYVLKIFTGNKNIHEKSIRVISGDFEKSYIEIEKSKGKLVNTDKDSTLHKKKERDKQLIREAYNKTNPKQLWEKSFIWPVEGKITTDYGATRYVNGNLSNRHSGIDIAAAKGTPVKAVNNGTVKLANKLVVTGNTVIIDHGRGVFSSYSHLEQIKVNPREKVSRGKIIGNIGSTGFSTGPHLHWVIKINGVFINPRQILKLEN